MFFFCHEKFFGSDEKKIQKIILKTSYKTCLSAVRYKNTPYGKLKKSKNNLWISSGKENFKCKWLKNTYVSFTRFKLFMLNGHLVDNDLNIQQDITATKSGYNLNFVGQQKTPLI